MSNFGTEVTLKKMQRKSYIIDRRASKTNSLRNVRKFKGQNKHRMCVLLIEKNKKLELEKMKKFSLC